MKFFNFIFLTILILFTACTSKVPNIISQEDSVQQNSILEEISPTNPYSYQTLSETINMIADQLLESNIKQDEQTSIILTSYVNLNALNETTTFGRILSESMFNELHVRGFKITDFRGQDAVSVNEDGEFHITRDVDRLKDNIESAKYILVGTFTKFEYESLIINSRIIDSITGEVISTARTIFTPKNCDEYNICLEKKTIETTNIVTKKTQVDSSENTISPIFITKDKK